MKLDEWDYELSYKGQIIGFETIRDTQNIVINVRSWIHKNRTEELLGNSTAPFDPSTPPALSNFPKLLIFDLINWTVLRKLTGHEALSPANRCCFLMPSASNRLAACGDETGKVYVWEYRHSKGSILPHMPLYHQGILNEKKMGDHVVPSNVNCVAFHPLDDSMLITAGDDCRVRLFKSQGYRNFLKRCF